MKKILAFCISFILLFNLGLQASAATSPDKMDIIKMDEVLENVPEIHKTTKDFLNNGFTLNEVDPGDGGGSSGTQSFVFVYKPFTTTISGVTGTYQFYDFYFTPTKAYQFAQALGQNATYKAYNIASNILFGAGATGEAINFFRNVETKKTVTSIGHLGNFILMGVGKVLELRIGQYSDLKEKVSDNNVPGGHGVHIRLMTIEGGIGVTYQVEQWDGVNLNLLQHTIEESGVLNNTMPVPSAPF